MSSSFAFIEHIAELFSTSVDAWLNKVMSKLRLESARPKQSRIAEYMWIKFYTRKGDLTASLIPNARWNAMQTNLK